MTRASRNRVSHHRRDMTACITIEFMLLYNVQQEKFWKSVELVEQALAAGALTEPPMHITQLNEIAAAHQQIEAGSASRVLIAL